MFRTDVRFTLHRARQPIAGALAICLGLTATARMSAAIFTVNPPSGATGVSPSANVVFTFSEPMDTSPDVTQVTFVNQGGFPPLPVNTTVAWNAAGTEATYTPVPSWPNNATIQWVLAAATADPVNPDYLDGFGTFRTGSSGSGGSGTNAVTTFSVGIHHAFIQTNDSAPVLDADLGYTFRADTTLASNRTASLITVRTPPMQTLPLIQFPTAPENFFYIEFTNDLAQLNAKYPGGDYLFSVMSTTNQQVTVTLSDPAEQPSTPHIVNFSDAQTIDVTQPFTLTWDSFVGGTTNDAILVQIGEDFETPATTAQGGLDGTATSVEVPPNTLKSNSDYLASVSFLRLDISTNGISYATVSDRTTTTTFSARTIGPIVSEPAVLTNAVAVSASQFQFQVQAATGQLLAIESSTTLRSNSWSTVFTTNAPAPVTRITLPMTPPDYRFFRIRSN